MEAATTVGNQHCSGFLHAQWFKLAARIDAVRRAIRTVLPTPFYARAAEALDLFWGLLRLRPKTYFALRACYPDRASSQQLVRFRLPTLQHPFYLRAGTSDAAEVVHSVVRETYGVFVPQGRIKVIVDAGANIGDTTAWFLSRFKDAMVVGIEPDPENFALLKRNCLPYGSRAILRQAALWPSRTRLNLVRSDSWAGTEVTDAGEAGTYACDTISIASLLDDYNIENIDILKCDIEGAETRVFAEGSETWLPRVRCVTIELHGREATRTVHTAARRHGFLHAVHRDTHVFWK